MNETNIDGYRPDSWSVLEIKTEDQTIHKIIVGFVGGYLYGDSWRINSGIVSIEETDKLYIVHGVSKSVYLLSKHCEGVRGYAAIIAASLLTPSEGVKVVQMKDIIGNYPYENSK